MTTTNKTRELPSWIANLAIIALQNEAKNLRQACTLLRAAGIRIDEKQLRNATANCYLAEVKLKQWL